MKAGFYIRCDDCKNSFRCTDEIKTRRKTYDDLFKQLINFEMQSNDARIIIVAYDFCLHSNFPLDFLTFDQKCYDGANSLIWCFDNVKGLNDYS